MNKKVEIKKIPGIKKTAVDKSVFVVLLKLLFAESRLAFSATTTNSISFLSLSHLLSLLLFGKEVSTTIVEPNIPCRFFSCLLKFYFFGRSFLLFENSVFFSSLFFFYMTHPLLRALSRMYRVLSHSPEF